METLTNKMWSVVEELCDQLKEQLSGHDDNMIMTDDENKSTIWGYTLMDGYVDEKQVKAIQVENNEVYVLIDDFAIKYSREDALREQDNWYSLRHGDILTIQTAYYIAESIHEYL